MRYRSYTPSKESKHKLAPFIMGPLGFTLAMVLIIAQTVSPSAGQACPDVMCPPCFRNAERIIAKPIDVHVPPRSPRCPTCDCRTPICNPPCSIGYWCQEVETICRRFPCFPATRCVPITNPCDFDVDCRPGCTRRLDFSGCPYCDCPTCKTKICRDGYVCIMRRRPCRRRPCPIVPICIPVDPCSGFSTDSQCQFRSASCPLVPACNDDCYTFQKKNECPKCICPNPCKDLYCDDGYECELQETDTDGNPEAFCTSKLNTTIPT